MLKILQARLHQYVNHEIPDVQAGFRKGRGTRDQIAKICWIIETSTSALLTTLKTLTEWITTNCKDMGITDHLTCLQRNLYAGQEETVRTWCGTMDWFKIGKGVQQGCIMSDSLQTCKVPMDCSPLGSSVHGILQARILEWVAIPFSKGSSWPRDQIWISCFAGRFFTIWATREAP